MGVLDATGMIGSDAEVRSTASGMKVANFSIAIDGKKGSDGKNETTWVKVAIFGKMAESLAQYLTKGKIVRATGPGYIDLYQHQGKQRADLKMNANNVVLLGGAKSAPAQARTEEPAEDNWLGGQTQEPF